MTGPSFYLITIWTDVWEGLADRVKSLSDFPIKGGGNLITFKASKIGAGKT